MVEASPTKEKIAFQKAAEAVQEQFRLRGIAVAEWARQNGFNPTLVYQVLNASHVPARGKSHQIAVVLGLKEGIIDDDINFLKPLEPSTNNKD